MYLLVIFILVISVLFYKGLKVLNYVDHVAGIMEMIPGPTPYPFVGNVFQFGLRPDEYPKKLLQYCRKYEFQGFRSLVFFQYHVILSDPAEIKTILSSSTLLNKYHLYKYIRPWLGDGLLTACSARWLKHRKLILPAFDMPAILNYMNVVNERSTNFIKKCEDFSCDGNIFDIQDLVYRCTLDIVHENATGVPSNTLNGEETGVHRAIWDLCADIHERTFSIVKRFRTLYHLTPQYWKQQKALMLLKRNIKQIIENRRNVLEKSPAEASQNKKPFLDNLLTAKIDQRPLKFSEIFQEISTFIYTGHETIASAVSFTIYTLSRHPEVQSKVAAELQKILGTDLSMTPTTSQLDAMTYLESVIRETLRLYPSVPVIARTNRKSIDINGTKIASKTTVLLCLLAMGYNEKYFPNPCEFKPERFIKKDADDDEGISAYKSVPFSSGPRGCIAEKFAMMQLKAMISKVIRRFEILPPIEGMSAGINDHTNVDCIPESTYDPVLNIRVTLQSENGIQIRLKKREYK